MKDLPEVDCSLGAPMGRSSVELPTPEAILADKKAPPYFVHIGRLAWVDGDYDTGGAYWGYVAGDHIYRCTVSMLMFGEIGDVFLRATSLEDATIQIKERIPGVIVNLDDSLGIELLDPFTRAALECAFWLWDDDAPSGEYPTDRIDDFYPKIHPKCLEKFMAECAAFQKENREALMAFQQNDSQNGHDFWLTRNHAGTGFWDREQCREAKFREIGDRLTESAHACGERNVSRDEDVIYIE